MNSADILVLILVGAAIGFAGGLFAIGGALIAIPVLTFAFSLSQHDAQGTSLLMALASAIVTMILYARRGLLSVRGSIVMVACSSVAGLAAAQAVRYVSDGALQRGFGSLLIALAVLMWFARLGESDNAQPLPPRLQIVIGTSAGALSGLFVVGGALVAVPILERLGRYSQQRAQATALLMLVPASAFGLCVYGANGFVRWETAVPLAIGALALAPFGARVAIRMQARVLRRCFAVVQACAGLLLLVGR